MATTSIIPESSDFILSLRYSGVAKEIAQKVYSACWGRNWTGYACQGFDGRRITVECYYNNQPGLELTEHVVTMKLNKNGEQVQK